MNYRVLKATCYRLNIRVNKLKNAGLLGLIWRDTFLSLP